MDNIVQIDVKELQENTAVCNLWADGRCVKIVMRLADYETLRRDGFFIRSGKDVDSAGVLNTSAEYTKKKI